MANKIERDVYILDNKIKETIDYVQGTNTIPIIFNFRDYIIPNGTIAKVYVQKPSGKAVYNSAAISRNTVTVDVTTQMFAEEGFNNMQIQLSNGTDDLVSFDQPVHVFWNRTDENAPESKNESSLLNEIQEAVDEANKAAENANNAAEKLGQQAEAGDFSASVDVGTVTTGAAGTEAAVTNSGTTKDAIFNFTIPQGQKGDPGAKGDPGSIENLDSADVSFTQASERENIASGESISTLFGKIAKWFSDIGEAAFRSVANVLTISEQGVSVLDASQGNVLANRIGDLNDLQTTEKTNIVGAVNEIKAGGSGSTISVRRVVFSGIAASAVGAYYEIVIQNAFGGKNISPEKIRGLWINTTSGLSGSLITMSYNNSTDVLVFNFLNNVTNGTVIMSVAVER